MTTPRDLASIAPGLSPDAPQRERILSCHAEAIERSQDGYIDPVSGFFVMTAQYHLTRGTCCANTCRHCPFTPLATETSSEQF